MIATMCHMRARLFSLLLLRSTIGGSRVSRCCWRTSIDSNCFYPFTVETGAVQSNRTYHRRDKPITNKRHVLCQGTRFGTGHTQEADVLDQRNADDRHPGNCSTPCFRLGGITFLEVPSRHQTNLFPVSLKFRRNNSHWLRDIWQQLICRFLWDYGCISTQDPWRGSSER